MVSLILICLPAFSRHNVNLRVNCKKLFKMPYRLNITGNFFAYHTVNAWNSLANNVVISRNCNTYKHVLQNISLYNFTCRRALLECRC